MQTASIVASHAISRTERGRSVQLPAQDSWPSLWEWPWPCGLKSSGELSLQYIIHLQILILCISAPVLPKMRVGPPPIGAYNTKYVPWGHSQMTKTHTHSHHHLFSCGMERRQRQGYIPCWPLRPSYGVYQKALGLKCKKLFGDHHFKEGDLC